MKKDAKLTALKDMRKMASDLMGDGLKGSMVAPKMKSQVTVAADTPQNLQKGLDKAKEMVPNLDEYMQDHEDMTKHSSRMMQQGDEGDQTDIPESDDNQELEQRESPEQEASEESPEDQSHEDSKIAELERQIAELKAKKK